MPSFDVLGPVEGTATLWLDEEGWGAVASPEVNGDVWTHFSHIEMDGDRRLTVGEPVRFTYETPGQDGYPHRAVRVHRLAPYWPIGDSSGDRWVVQSGHVRDGQPRTRRRTWWLDSPHGSAAAGILILLAALGAGSLLPASAVLPLFVLAVAAVLLVLVVSLRRGSPTLLPRAAELMRLSQDRRWIARAAAYLAVLGAFWAMFELVDESLAEWLLPPAFAIGCVLAIEKRLPPSADEESSAP